MQNNFQEQELVERNRPYLHMVARAYVSRHPARSYGVNSYEDYLQEITIQFLLFAREQGETEARRRTLDYYHTAFELDRRSYQLSISYNGYRQAISSKRFSFCELEKAGGTEDETERAIQRMDIAHTLHQLSERDRIIFEMRRDGAELAEIGKQVGLSVSGVSRALSKMGAFIVEGRKNNEEKDKSYKERDKTTRAKKS